MTTYEILKRDYRKLEEENRRMRQALKTTCENIRSIKYCVDGVVCYDRWLDVAEEALKRDSNL